jgi:hypothetical protein
MVLGTAVSMPGMATGGGAEILRMGSMALTVSVLAPALVLTLRDHLPDRLSRVPAPATLAGFVVLHDSIMVSGPYVGAPVRLLYWVAVLAGAFVFWLPVAGRRRISDAGRIIYLFIAGPSLDVSAVAMIGITGHSAGGLAMIAGMLPIGAVELVLFWRWAMREERAADAALVGRPPSAGVEVVAR